MELIISQLGEFVLVDLEKKGKQIKDSLEKVHLYFIILLLFEFENKTKIKQKQIL